MKESKWICVAIAKQQASRIDRIILALGYGSRQQFVQEAVRIWLQSKEGEYEQLQEDLKTGKQQREGWSD
jgi:Arc/MetJ-type ribon-helix-helix transcriptional regulator